MPTSAIIRAPLARVATRWRALGLRPRVAIALIAATACLGGPWLASRWGRWPIRAVLRTPGGAWPLAFSPDGRAFATSGEAGITLWDAANGRRRATWPDRGGRHAILGDFSPDGRTFASVSSDHPRPLQVDLIDVATGRTRASLPTPWTTLYHHVAFVDQGRGLRALMGDVSRGGALEVLTWDVATGRQAASRTVSCKTSGCATEVSPDGRWLAILPFGGRTIQVWDLDADREAARLAGPPTAVPPAFGLAFSADGRSLASGREDGSFEVWDIATRRVLSTFPGHADGYRSWGIKFAPDGRTLASRGEQARPTLIDHLQSVAMQALTGQGRRPASEVIVVEVGTGRALARESSAVHSYFSPDGTTIATSHEDGVHLHPAPGR